LKTFLLLTKRSNAPTKTKRHHRIDEYRYLDKRLSISASGNTRLPQKDYNLLRNSLLCENKIPTW